MEGVRLIGNVIYVDKAVWAAGSRRQQPQRSDSQASPSPSPSR